MLLGLRAKMKVAGVRHRLKNDTIYLEDAARALNCTPLEVAAREAVMGVVKCEWVTQGMNDTQMMMFARILHEIQNSGE